MLLRMYTRWAEQHGCKVEFLEETEGEEAGIKSATIQVKAATPMAGSRRERRAPARAHLAVRFERAPAYKLASVNVYPVDDRIKVDISEVRRARRYLARERAVAARQQDQIGDPPHSHIPTNIVVYCQNDRSQHRNRAQAWDMLRARLYEMEMKKREAGRPSTRPTRPTSASATPSAAMCCSPTRW